MNSPWENATPEQRKAWVAKGVASRKATIEARKAEAVILDARRAEAYVYAKGLGEKIDALEKKLASLEQVEAFGAISVELTGRTLLHSDEIVAKAMPWERVSGVYFLVHYDEIVYVGQSVNLHSRISAHTDKQFDRFAFVPCNTDMLDKLESLYIHCLRPKYNGENHGIKAAPFRLDELINLTS